MPTKSNETRGYSKLWLVIFFVLVILVLVFYINNQYEASDSDTSMPVKTVTGHTDPLDATYIIDGEQVSLTDGASVSPVAPGSAAEIETKVFGTPVLGDINGDGKQDAVLFLYQETSGTGIFFYVAAAINKDGSYIGTNAVILGDRIAPQNINISNGSVAVNYAVRKDDEPMTADPSVGVTKYLKIQAGELVEVGSTQKI